MHKNGQNTFKFLLRHSKKGARKERAVVKKNGYLSSVELAAVIRV